MSQNSPNVVRISAPRFRQHLDNSAQHVRTTSKLAWILGGTCPGHAACTFSATFGQVCVFPCHSQRATPPGMPRARGPSRAFSSAPDGIGPRAARKRTKRAIGPRGLADAANAERAPPAVGAQGSGTAVGESMSAATASKTHESLCTRRGLACHERCATRQDPL